MTDEHVKNAQDGPLAEDVVAAVPHLRAFGRSLSGSRDLADDLVQETLLKAWAARTLPVVQRHLMMAQEAEKAIKANPIHH